MMTPVLREAFEFHRAYGGYSVPPGPLVCALRTARNELALRAHIDEDLARIRWVDDPDLDIDLWAEELQAEAREKLANGEWESRGCIIEARAANGDWRPVASLWGIVSPFDANDTYPRVVEGELAGEALEEIAKTPFKTKGYVDLARHVGHEIECVDYAGGANVALECLDCSEVLLDFDRTEGEA